MFARWRVTARDFPDNDPRLVTKCNVFGEMHAIRRPLQVVASAGRECRNRSFLVSKNQFRGTVGDVQDADVVVERLTLKLFP